MRTRPQCRTTRRAKTSMRASSEPRYGRLLALAAHVGARASPAGRARRALVVRRRRFRRVCMRGTPRGHLGSAADRIRGESAGRAQGSKDLERDAPTVLTGERRARRRWRTIGWASFGVAAAGAAHRRLGRASGGNRESVAAWRSRRDGTHADRSGSRRSRSRLRNRRLRRPRPVAGVPHGHGEDGCRIKEPFPRAQPRRMQLARAIRPGPPSPSARRQGAEPRRWPPRRPSPPKTSTSRRHEVRCELSTSKALHRCVRPSVDEPRTGRRGGRARAQRRPLQGGSGGGKGRRLRARGGGLPNLVRAPSERLDPAQLGAHGDAPRQDGRGARSSQGGPDSHRG